MAEGRKRAFVTLGANESFLPGVRCLARSLARTGTRAPLVCLVPEPLLPVAERALAQERVELRAVEPLPLSPAFIARHTNEAIESLRPMARGTKPSFHVRLLNFLKLQAWSMTEYRKVVFLDADTLVLRPLDRLFDYPSFSAAPNLYATLQDFHRINSGVLVLEPSERVFARMLQALDAPGAFWARTDQTFLEQFFKGEGAGPLGLPYFFNTLQYLWFNQPQLWHWPTIHVVHYQFEKPWDEGSFQVDAKSRIRRRLLAPLVDLWHAIDGGDRHAERLMVDNVAHLARVAAYLSRLRALESGENASRMLEPARPGSVSPNLENLVIATAGARRPPLGRGPALT